jgi:deoxyribodipyrimidine photo-lyase
LSSASDALLYEPWKDEALLKRSGYPRPMIDLGASRQSALTAYQASRG